MIKRFENLNSYLSYLDKSKATKLFLDNVDNKIEDLCSISTSPGNIEFTGTKSYADATDLMRFGDRKNFESLNREIKKVARLKGSGEQIRMIAEKSVVGCLPIIPAYLSGLPTNMLNIRRQKVVNNKVLNVVYSTVVDWTWSTNDIIKAGAALLSAINSIEKQGYRVNLYVVNLLTSRENEKFGTLIKIKSSDEYLDLLKCAYPIINPSFIRRHLIKYVESLDFKDKKIVRNYGSVINDSKTIKELLKPILSKIDYLVTAYEIRSNNFAVSIG